MSSLKELVAELRRVYEPPTARAWGLTDVKLAKLLKAIDEMPVDDGEAFTARFRAELVIEHDKVGQAQFDVADAMAAFERARRSR